MRELSVVFCVVLAILVTISICVKHGIDSSGRYFTSICGKEQVIVVDKEFATLEISCKILPKERQ